MQPSMNMLSLGEERGIEFAEISLLREGATTNNPEVCYALGLALQEIGSAAASCEARNWFAAAVECFERAAGLGSPEALFALALAHGRGQGVPQDLDRMRRFTARAAQAGHPEAQYWLGNYYRFGEGEFEQDLERAAYWYERASCADHPKAIYSLGLHTLLGHGVKPDICKGWDLIEKAAKLGVVDSMMCMATMIDSDEVSVDDPAEPLHWHQRPRTKASSASGCWIAAGR